MDDVAEPATAPRRGRPPRVPRFSPDLVAEITLAVYTGRLGAGGAERMLEDDADGGKKLRKRSDAYTAVVRETMNAMADRFVFIAREPPEDAVPHATDA